MSKRELANSRSLWQISQRYAMKLFFVHLRMCLLKALIAEPVPSWLRGAVPGYDEVVLKTSKKGTHAKRNHKTP
jgi:hypothetical protein